MNASSGAGTGETPRCKLSPFSDADVWNGLAHAFERAIDTPTREAMFALRVAATEAAGSTRRLGLPPERAVITLKTVLACHGGCGWAPLLDADPKTSHAASLVYTKLFTWFITAFYDD
jgi:hypothetical protein